MTNVNRRETMSSRIIMSLFLASAMFGTAHFKRLAAAQASVKPTTATQPPGKNTPPPGPVLANPHYPFTVQDKIRKNPEKFTTESVEKGKSIYSSQCTMCHGATGNGRGDLATSLKLNLPDFTKSTALKGYTDGELFKILSVGNGMMPGQGQRLRDMQLWDLINFLRAMGGAVPAKSASSGRETR
jgi:mono/diheme cytochrome c family protein